MTWGGIGNVPSDRPLHAIHIDTLQVHKPNAEPLALRSGMLAIPLACTSDASVLLEEKPDEEGAHVGARHEDGDMPAEPSLDGVLMMCGEPAVSCSNAALPGGRAAAEQDTAPYLLTVPLGGVRSRWSVGQEVRVVGLQTESQNNGKRGIVRGYQESSQGVRVQVRLLDEDGADMALLPKNLERLVSRSDEELEELEVGSSDGEEDSDEEKEDSGDGDEAPTNDDSDGNV